MIRTEVLLSDLLQRRTEITKKITSLETRKYRYPDGHLRIKKRGNTYWYYYKISDKKDSPKSDIYLPKSEMKKIKELAQRCYNQKALIYLREELHALNQLIKTYQTRNVDSIYTSFCEARKELVTPVFLPSQEFAQEWSSQPFTPKPFHPDDKSEHYTAKGERVRSKSEIMIADALYRYGITYKYECPLYLSKSSLQYTFHPDFTILNMRTGKIYYLEHLGKMDDAGYTEDACNRIREYEKNNILIGDQLLLTMETLSRPFDIRTVENMIEVFFT